MHAGWAGMAQLPRHPWATRSTAASRFWVDGHGLEANKAHITTQNGDARCRFT